MSNNKFLALTMVLLTFLISKNTFSQSQTTYDFLNLNVGARASSLGGSFTSTVNDVNSIFYNPAGLSTLTRSQAQVGFFKYLLDINSGYASYTQKYKDLGYIGAGIRYMNYGSFDKFDEESNALGTFSANDIALSLGYANVYRNNFNYGLNLKFIYSQIGDFNSTAIALDMGVLYTIPSSKWDFGISLLNAGTQLSEYSTTKEDLPLDLRVGVSKTLEHLPLTVHFDLDNLTSDEENFWDRFKYLSVGGEFVFSENVQFRIGYDNGQRQDLETGTSVGIAGFSAGLGIKFLEQYRVDYAFNSMGNIGTTNRIDLGFEFR